MANLPPVAAAFAQASGFEAKPGRIVLLPGPDGTLAAVLFGIEPEGGRADPFAVGRLPEALPEGTYRLEGLPGDAALAALAWRLAGYRFGRYRERPVPRARLAVPAGVDAEEVDRIADAVAAGRDLVNTPANDLGPAEIEAASRALAARFGAACTVVAGDDLETGFPLIAAVGRASPRAPRLIDLTWGDPQAPRVTLVGKGVVFDTGGLDLKPPAAMLLMKKDMAGAAVALAAAEMVMGAGLPLRLRVLIPTVENAVAGEAFRPGDVLRSRRGLTVEIGNTDAEGRLILADALSLADEEAPELVFDFATLTGAARTALGPDLPALFTEDDALAAELSATGLSVHDPVWRMPLWAPYGALLDSKVADLNNVSSGPFAGAVTAALFLRRFVSKAAAHVHLDLYGWNPGTKPGRPEGGEVQTARLVYALLKARYAAPKEDRSAS
ncbi:leucyl aminopeptidase family protein [Methylobacterium nonmethylotrophicum]|uniref:Leucyl aminopeptidase family protein n=2 Tax=Methylobacterium nonmethylotrophicum TaxID=1141884 RepID=A0A4Z0NUF9_9HYPH|nr:leucyl aminopeptidase family protein [Methylobacterium nonmethylotrophicum]